MLDVFVTTGRATVSLLVLFVAAGCATGGEPKADEPSPHPSETALEQVLEGQTFSNRIIRTSGSGFFLTPKVSSVLHQYPDVVVGRIDGVLQSFDPRPGFLGLSQEEIDELQSGPKGGPLPSDALARPPGSGSSVYSVTVVDGILGSLLSAGDKFALMQPGGVFEDTAYENQGDPVLLPGSTYILFLKPFDLEKNDYRLPEGYDGLPSGYQRIFRSSTEARYLINNGDVQPIAPDWMLGCDNCDVASLLGHSVDEAIALILDAKEGTPLPSPAARFSAPTAAPYTLSSVALDADPSGNSRNLAISDEACAGIALGESATIDITVRGIPPFDAATYAKGIAGFGATIEFDPAVLVIEAVNPSGDENTILAAGGERIAFEVVDTDGELGPPTTGFPAEKGFLRLDFVDASRVFEDGDGVLAKLVVRAVGVGETELEISQLEVYDASASTYDVASVSGAKIFVAGQCP